MHVCIVIKAEIKGKSLFCSTIATKSMSGGKVSLYVCVMRFSKGVLLLLLLLLRPGKMEIVHQTLLL